MYRTISPQDMREMEKAFMSGTGYPSLLLMEHAAQAVVEEIRRFTPRGPVIFVCGTGNNGGDGCAAARLYRSLGGEARVWLMVNPSQMKGDAGINARLLSVYGIEERVIYEEVPRIPEDVVLICDAFLGTGLDREVAGPGKILIDRINESGRPVVSVDIPSGIEGSTGRVMGCAVRATSTVTFHRTKHGLCLFPGRGYAGEVRIAEIGIVPDWDGAQGYEVLEREDARALLPKRPREGHKGTFGHLLAIAGSEGMGGAAVLCARAALRSGAGLVSVACPSTVLTVVQTLAPCAMAIAASEGLTLDTSARVLLEDAVQGKRALVIGPGLGRSGETWQAIHDLVEGDSPKVVDADGLNLLSEHGGVVGENSVLTPHPGEMARLLGTTVREVTAAPVDAALQLSQETGACVVLKGATTVIAQGEEVTFNLTGCEAMGTGGSGDVLSGVIGGLMAQGMSPLDAARCGTYFHGLAGMEAAEKMGSRAVTAMDIVENLRIE